MSPTVSVIIPCYNARNTVKRCLDSLLAQSYTNFEIIAVDDGSTDGTADYLEELYATEMRLRIITEPNQGLGKARNTGIYLARGKYLSFVDADDTVENNFLSELVNCARTTGADVVRCGSYRIHSDGNKTVYNSATHDSPGGVAALDLLLADKTCAPVWTLLVKRDLCLCNKIFFAPTVNEDALFTAMILLACRHFVEFPAPLYHYREYDVSLMNQKKGDNPVYSYFRGYMTLLDYVREWLTEAKKVIDLSPSKEQDIYVYFQNLSLINLCRVEPMMGTDFDDLLNGYATEIFGDKREYVKAGYYLYKRLMYIIQQQNKELRGR